MKKTVLLSIKPKWWEKIASGDKNIEIRNIWNSDIKRIIFYESAPVKKIVGVADCISKKVLLNYDDSIEDIFDFIKNSVRFKTAMSKIEFRRYVYKHDYTWFIYITNLIIYNEPKEINDYGYTRAPQNYFVCFGKIKDYRTETRIKQLLENSNIKI